MTYNLQKIIMNTRYNKKTKNYKVIENSDSQNILWFSSSLVYYGGAHQVWTSNSQNILWFSSSLYTMEGHIKYGQITARIFSDFQAPLCTMEVHIKCEQVTERVLYLVKISSWVFKIHQAIFLKIFDYMPNNFLCFMRVIPYFGFLLKENEKREKIFQLRKDCETFTIVSESGVQKSIIDWNLGFHSLT